MSDLQTQFEAAIQRVETAEGDQEPSNEVKLQMYALYKQGTQGDVSGKKPGTFDLVGKAKWAAWEKLKGTSQDDAMQQYVDKVEELMS